MCIHIFYGFEVLTSEEIARDFEIAKLISEINGYIPTITSNSTGGYSDWVSLNLRVPAYTIEVGNPALPTPIPLEAIPEAIEKNRDVPLALLDYLNTTNTLSKFSLYVGG